MREDWLRERKSQGKSCYYCHDAGIISATKKVNGLEYSFAFRCPDENCIAAEFKCNPYDVRWSDRFAGDYVPQWDK